MIRTILDALRGQPAHEQRASLSDPVIIEMMLGARTAAGPIVAPSNALSIGTVYACVRVLAGDVGQMPLKLYRRLERGKEPATDHPLYDLLHQAPNPEMSAFSFLETLMGHVILWGNAYAEIDWDNRGYPRALWPLLPDRMTPKRENGQLRYEYRPDGVQVVMLPAYNVLHVPGLSFDGVVGYSPVRLQMDTLGGERAQAEYGWRFFANGARPGVVLTHPGKLSADAASRLRDSWNSSHAGVSNAHRTAILEEGMSIEKIGVPPEEAQFLQTRQFTRREIAGWFRVPPQMIGDIEHATYASSEQFSRDYVVFALGQWLRRFEMQIGLQCLVGEERQTLFPQFVRDSLVITQTSERFAAYATAIQSGVMTPNEAREKENLNPLPGGDDLLLPLNMAKADNGEPLQPEPEPEPDDDDERSALLDAWQAGRAEHASALLDAWLDDVQRRLIARIDNDVRQQGGKALRNGGRLALSEWGEEQTVDWRAAGEAMLAPLLDAGAYIQPDVGAWVIAAYHDSVRRLING